MHTIEYEKFIIGGEPVITTNVAWYCAVSLEGVHETVRLSDPPAVMFDCPLGLKASTPLEIERAVVLVSLALFEFHERYASIDSVDELSKLVIVTAPFEGMYAGAWIETKDPGAGFDEKYGVQLNVKITLEWLGSLLDRTRVSTNGPWAASGTVHTNVMIDDPDP